MTSMQTTITPVRTLLLAALIWAGCQGEDRDTGEAGVAISVDTASIAPTGGKLATHDIATTKALEDARAVVVTIEDGSGTEVYSAEQIELIAFGGEFLSEPLSLEPGSYSLTQMLVLDAADQTIYATPITGSPLAYLVANPLPLPFTVSAHTVTSLRPEVLSTAQQTPADFGYVSFGLDEVEVLDFLLTAFTYESASQVLVPSTASVSVADGGGTVLYSGDLLASTNTIRVPDGHAQYQVTVSRSGYRTYDQTFSRADLAAHFDGATGGPLEVVLELASTLSGVTEIAAIPTNGAEEWESFQIGADHYLAVANFYNGATRNVASRIYRWDGTGFQQVQSIATNGAMDWEHFQIGADHYLALANFHDDATCSVSSTIYQWNGTSFVALQSIATSCAIDWEHFQVGTDHYLALANRRSDTSPNVASKIYQWDGAAFQEVQSIATSGATEWEHFQIGSDHYLAVANQLDGTTFNIDSKIYRWDGAAFQEVQSIATSGATDWEHFQIGDDHYLAVSNTYDDITGNIDSKIYRWDGAAFQQVQSIATNSASAWQHFQIGNDHYLAVASYWNGVTENIDSKIYRWTGTSFAEVQLVATSGAVDWEHFQIGVSHYLAVANHKTASHNIDSRVYRLTLQ